MHRPVSLLIVSHMLPERAPKSFLRHLSPSLSMAPSTFPRISRPLGLAASVARMPDFTAPSRSAAPLSEQTSTKVALPAFSPITPQFPQARSACRGTLYLHRRQLLRRPYPASSSSSMEIPLWPPSYSMMNWPLSISSLVTAFGSTPNFSLIMRRAMTGLTDPPQLTPTMTMLSRLTSLRFESSSRPIMSQPLTTMPIFLFANFGTYSITSLERSTVPQWSEPAQASRSFGFVTSAGIASYRSTPRFTARTASTVFDSSAYFSSSVTAPPHSAFFSS